MRRLILIFLLLSLNTAVQAQSYGLTSRPAFTAFNGGALPPNASTISGSWSAVPAFANLTFQNPMGIVQKPGTNTMIVWEREGRVWSFTKDASITIKTKILDISAHCQGWDDCGLLNLVFHPNFASNGYVFIYYTYPGIIPVRGSSTVRPTTYQTVYDRLARFTMKPDGTIDPNSELVLIHQKSGTVWHNGSGMFFHPGDGFLYVVNGDDFITTNAQRINYSLHSGVLRIDVDQRGGAISHPIPKQPLPSGSYTANYYIPNDNPFVGQTGVLEEFYAIGIRSPHRMTRDAVTGRIFISDVGDALREEINVIEPGDVAANFQWPKFEGLVGDMTQPYRGLNKKPIIDYSHSDGQAVIGGYVYRGAEFPELYGKYVFGDNMVGTIWYLDESTTPATKVAICKLPNGPGPNSGESYVGLSSFGVDADGELYLTQLSSTGGKVYKLAKTGAASNTMPATLSATGIFTDLPNLTISPAFQRYQVNNPFWSDGAIKERWFAIPDGQKIGYAATSEWSFPQGSVFVKHFDLGTDETNPTVKRRLETRVMVRDDQGFVYGASYKWRADHSDSDLVSTAENEDITITTASGTRTQRWLFPSRQDCLTCHTAASKGVLGVNSRQLNLDRLFTETSVTDNQLRAWNHVGYFAPSIDEASIASTPKLAAMTDSAATLEHRVRSYLDSNCSHCHRPGGGARGLWDGRFEVPLANAGIVNGMVLNDLGTPVSKVVAPQSNARSVLHTRINTASQPYVMPPLAKSLVDDAAVAVIEQWIASLSPPTPQPIAAPWATVDIGNTAIGGVASTAEGEFTLQASGADFGGNSDDIRFVYRDLTGDGTLVVRLISTANESVGTLAGLTMRESLAPGAKQVSMLHLPGGTKFVWRITPSNLSAGHYADMPWLRLRRAGSVFTASISPDGITWTQVGQQTITMATTIKVGLALCGRDNSKLATAVFDSFQFVPGVPWLISTQPRSQMVKVGQLVDFAVETTGEPPTSYRWRKNGVALTRAVASRYAFKAALSSAGSYSVLTGGKLASTAASLVVVDKATFSTNLAPGATATFTVSYAGTGATFQWLKGGQPVQNSGTRVTGATSSKLTIKLLTLGDIGDYECVVTAHGSTMVLGPYHLHVLSKPAITAPSPAAASVSHEFNWQLTANEPVTTYTVKGLPPGLVYNGKTGLISGTPNVGSSTSYTITITATNAAGTGPVQTYPLTIEPFPAFLVGTFSGLVNQDAANDYLGGALTSFVVNSNGTLTGTLVWGTKTYSLNKRAIFISGSDPTLSHTIARGTLPSLVLALTLNRTTGVITGNINGVTVSARKQVTSATAVSYNIALDLPIGSQGNLAVPQGTGWARATIDTKATVTITGRLADATVLTSTHPLRDDGSFAWRQLIYASKGIVQGAPAIAGSTLTSTLGWRKTAASSAQDYTYPTDFGQVDLVVDGVKFVPPTGTTFLGNADAADNAKIAFTHGGIGLAAITNLPNQTFRLTAAHKATFDPSTLINPNGVNMTITPGSGFFTGIFYLKDGTQSRNLTYYGIFIPGRNEARGAFTLRQLPNLATSPILSGTVRVHDSAIP